LFLVDDVPVLPFQADPFVAIRSSRQSQQGPYRTVHVVVVVRITILMSSRDVSME
jgi:hypothetical protein